MTARLAVIFLLPKPPSSYETSAHIFLLTHTPDFIASRRPPSSGISTITPCGMI
jgi:hypothetical protein